MFRTFIYADKAKVYEYKRIAEANVLVPKEVTNTKNGKLGFLKGALEAGVSTERVTVCDVAEDFGYDYQVFEEALQTRIGEDYFDFVVRDEFDLNTVPPMSLVRFQGYIYIPKEFDAFNVLHQFKDLILKETPVTDANEEMALTLFADMKADIPIVIDGGDTALFAKLAANNLFESIEDLEEYEEEDVIALCKVVSHKSGDSIKIYDPKKDFIKLNREMRRTIKFDDNSMDPICIDGPAVKVEVVAIYK